MLSINDYIYIIKCINVKESLLSAATSIFILMSSGSVSSIPENPALKEILFPETEWMI